MSRPRSPQEREDLVWAWVSIIVLSLLILGVVLL